MNIILLEKVRNLGNLGDQVRVRSGYGRNFLIPQGKAAIANEANKAQFEVRRAELEKVQATMLDQSKARGAKMAGATVQITAKAGDQQPAIRKKADSLNLAKACPLKKRATS